MSNQYLGAVEIIVKANEKIGKLEKEIERMKASQAQYIIFVEAIRDLPYTNAFWRNKAIEILSNKAPLQWLSSKLRDEYERGYIESGENMKAISQYRLGETKSVEEKLPCGCANIPGTCGCDKYPGSCGCQGKGVEERVAEAWRQAADMVDFKVKEAKMCGPMGFPELKTMRDKMLERSRLSPTPQPKPTKPGGETVEEAGENQYERGFSDGRRSMQSPGFSPLDEEAGRES